MVNDVSSLRFAVQLATKLQNVVKTGEQKRSQKYELAMLRPFLVIVDSMIFNGIHRAQKIGLHITTLGILPICNINDIYSLSSMILNDLEDII